MRRISIFLFLAAIVLAAGLITAQPLRAKEISLPYSGLTLLGNLELAEGKALKDGVVLMVHGTLAHNRMEIMATLQDLLKERQMNTLAVTLSLNQPGRRGMYDCARPHTHRHTDAVDEIQAWLDWLKGQGANNVSLLGHSRGGNQAAWFAAAGGQDALANLILVAPGSFPRHVQANRYKSRYGADLAPLLKKMEAHVAAEGKTLHKDVDMLGCRGATVSAATFTSYYGGGGFSDLRVSLQAIKIPTLVIAGSEDTVVPDLPAMLKGLESNSLKIRVIEDAGHFFRDLYAEDLADLIQEFTGEE